MTRAGSSKSALPQVIFLAGAGGMTGSAVAKRILEEMPEVRIRGTWYGTRPTFMNARLEYVQADLTLREDCVRAVAGCSMAVLAAAVTGGAAAAASSPQDQLTDNLVMDALLLEAAHAAGVRRIVYLSSATVYPESKKRIRERDMDWNKDPPKAHFGVGWAKRSAEKLCEFWAQKTGMAVTVLRCSNIYGPCARFQPGQSNFIPALIRKAVDKMDPFEVWGNAGVLRDVLYVDDAASAIVSLLKRRQPLTGTFNLCYGNSVSVRDVVNWTLQAAGHTPRRVLYKATGPTTASVRKFDGSRLRKATGWMPDVAPQEGIERTTHWWVENKGWWPK